MTDKPKRLNLLGALGDFMILLLLLAGAGFAGYYIGINQALAPIKYVAPGTPGAIPLSQLGKPITVATLPADSSQAATTPSSSAPASTSSAPAAQAVKGNTKYWLTSTGADYIGYSITVEVNDKPVDNFFGPGKTIDITRFVQPGKNSLKFDCKHLGDDYNNHKKDSKAILTVRLVSGPAVREDYPQSAVLLSCSRNATETESTTENLNFTAKD